MATGDILSCTIRSDGWSADLVIQGFTTGATYSFGLGTNNASLTTAKVILTVSSFGFDSTGSPTTVTRTVYGTSPVRQAYPNNSSTDETPSGGNLSVRIALSDYVFVKDKSGVGNSGTDVVATLAAGVVTNAGGAGQTSNAASAITVTNNSTLNYPKVIARWAWNPYERITTSFIAECVAFHAFGIACVKHRFADASGHSATTQSVVTPAASANTGDAIPIDVYAVAHSTTGLTQGDVGTANFTAYPKVGDATSLIDSDPTVDSRYQSQMVVVSSATGGTFTLTYASQTTTALAFNATPATVQTALAALSSIGTGNIGVSGPSAGGLYLVKFGGTLVATALIIATDSTTGTGHSISISVPPESLVPLKVLIDKNNTLAVYVSVDGTNGTAGGAASSTAAGARATPVQTLAQAFAALKTFNNSNHSDNSLNNCYVLMQNGTYTGPGTTTGSNTKSWCVIQSDLANGATEAGVIFSTAANQVFNGLLKLQDVTLSGSGTGMLRGAGTVGALCLYSCSLPITSTSAWYSWNVAYAIQNVRSASNQMFSKFATSRSPFALVRGNDGSASATTVFGDMYTVVGNKNHAPQFNETTNVWGNSTSENAIAAWNTAFAMSGTVWALQWCLTSDTDGIVVAANVIERISSGTSPLVQIAGDNTYTNVNNVLIVNNTITGARPNLDYQEVGNVNSIRNNWYEKFNCFYDFNTKTDVFANATRTLTDGVFTNNSTTLTSATANFVAGDVGAILSADSGLSNGFCTISALVNPTTVTLSVAANATVSGVRFGIGGYIANSNRIGNKAFSYGVGCRGSRYEISLFPRDFAGIDVAVVGSGAMGYTSNKSFGVSGTGNGDYTLTGTSPARLRIPAGASLVAHDVAGNSYNNAGYGSAGAYQRLSDIPKVVRRKSDGRSGSRGM